MIRRNYHQIFVCNIDIWSEFDSEIFGNVYYAETTSWQKNALFLNENSNVFNKQIMSWNPWNDRCHASLRVTMPILSKTFPLNNLRGV